MTADPRLLALPALQAEAERLAEELRVMPVFGYSAALRTRAHLHLLADPSRPASRDALCRLIAAKVGMDATCGLSWDVEDWGWSLRNGITWFGFSRPDPQNPTDTGGDDYLVVPALLNVTDPMEALILTAIAVLGGENG